MIKIFLLIMVMACSGCAHVSQDGRTFYGYGKADMKDGKVTHIESNSPIESFVNLSGINK